MAKLMCQECFERPAVYRNPHGKYRAGKDHDLCPQCYRSLRNKAINTGRRQEFEDGLSSEIRKAA